MLIAGNWKMNMNLEEAQGFCEQLKSGWQAREDQEILICCPLTLIHPMKEWLFGASVSLGAQDCSSHEKGAYTGEVSAGQLSNSGLTHCLVGHSERRQYHKESDELVFQKTQRLLAENITPIVCIGETLEQKQAGKTLETLGAQLELVSSLSSQIVIAYEPVWAIGTGEVASVEDIETAHGFIKETCPSPILYGGSVKPSNCEQIGSISTVDGFLIGGASLKAESLLEIYQKG